MKNMNAVTAPLIAAVSTLALASCSTTLSEGEAVSVRLKAEKPVPGVHCESSAILNALIFAGYDVTESEITGGGAALSFVFMKDTFPFIGGRNMDMKERFFKAAALEWNMRTPGEKEDGWAEITGALKDGFPVVLRVDMRFLPYRYGGKYGSKYMSFGAHYITLFGIDESGKTAIVSDTEFESFQTIKLSDLEKARFSKTKTFPPMGEYYWVSARPANGRELTANGRARLDADSLTLGALSVICEQFENGAMENLSRFPADLETFPEWSRSAFLYPAILSYMAANIEDNGTGGASFRMLFRDFVALMAERSSYREPLARLLPAVDSSIEEWHALSSAFLDSSARIKKLDKAGRQDEFKILAQKASALYHRERELFSAMKETLNTIQQE